MDGPRACLEVELPALIAAANRVFRPSGGDMAHDYPLLFSLENLRNLRVITDRDGVIAHAGLCIRTASWSGSPGGSQAEVAALGAVFTLAPHRGRGLGAAVVADALACARAQAAALALVSGDGPLYQRLGFATCPPAASWAWPPIVRAGAGADPASGSVRVRPFGSAGAGDLALAARWYDAEPVHFVRDRADWRALWGAQIAFAWPARWWIVEQPDGQPAGYLVVAQRTRRRVLELAGDRGALLAAAPLVADELVAPAHDADTARAAGALGWPRAGLPLPLASQWLASRWPPALSAPPPLPWYGLNYV